LIIAAAYLGLAPSTIPSYKQSDKVLHFVTFFLLSLSFYWILETSRRRNLHLTLFVCPVTLGIGSEIAQGLLPNGREFDPYDILANVIGSLLAIAICNWYHKRMLERKRQAKHYNLVTGDEEADLELGEGVGAGDRQETGITGASGAPTLEQEVDNWDENAEDWDDDEPTATEGETDGPKTPSTEAEDISESMESKKRSD